MGLTEIHHVNVRTEPSVISEIPTWVVRILVNNDGVRRPVPIGYIRNIDWSNAPVPTVEPEPVGTAACKMPNVARAETSSEMAVLPGVSEMQLWRVRFVTYPTPG